MVEGRIAMEGCLYGKSVRKQSESDKSYLYRVRSIATRKPPPSKRSSKFVHRQVELECKGRLANPMDVIADKESYDQVAKILKLPQIESPTRHYLDDCSTDTIIGFPPIRKSLMIGSQQDPSRGRESSIMLGSFSSRPSSSAMDMLQLEMTSGSVFDSFTQGQQDEATGSCNVYQYLDDVCEDDDDIYVNPPTPPPQEDKEPWVDKRSPYQKFFSLAEYKATRWRRGFSDSKPKELLTVQEREEHLYNLIASDFCNWVSQCQFKDVQLDETTITELFEIGMETPAVKAMCVQTKQLPCVPSQVAHTFDMPHKSEMAGLRRQVEWDKRTSELRERGVIDKPPWRCGNTMSKCSSKLRHTKSRGPRASSSLDKWFSTNLLTEEEKTAHLLWADLEKTKVFKQFCNWMIDNSKFKRPQYLEKKGYFKNKFDIDQSDRVSSMRVETQVRESGSDNIAFARKNLERMVSSDSNYADILEDLTQQIPSLKALLGFKVADKRADQLKPEKKLKKDSRPATLRPLTEGLSVDSGHDLNLHHPALVNHPEWP